MDPFSVLGGIAAVAASLGEEIGWRGFLLPEMFKLITPARAAVLVGLIWAAWHYPTILFAEHGATTPRWVGLPCFTATAIALTFQMAWMWFRSKSIWPAVIHHVSHNFWIQGFFDTITSSVAGPQYLLGEFGIGMAVSSAAVAVCLHWLAGIKSPETRPPA